MNVNAIRERLERSRAALLSALEGVTERDFAAEVGPGLTVVAALATLAPDERESIREARRVVAAPDRPRPSGGASATARATPPQVVHDLAGARYETLLFLDMLSQRQPISEAEEETVQALLIAVCDRETAAAEQVRARPAAQHANPA